MHRYVSRVPLRSISDSLYLSKSSVYDQKNLVRKLESLRTFTTSRGIVKHHDCFGYGRKSITRLLQVQIVDALRSNERSRASSLLSELGRGNYSLRADDFIYILEHCSKSPDPLFVMEIWRIMDEKEVHVNNRCYMLSIQALCKGGYLEEAFNLLNFVGENHDIHPILPVYNNFLRGCVQIRSLLHANQCLDLMEHQVLGKNEVTYSQFLKLAVLQQNLSAAHKIWKEYMTYYSMSIISLRKFIWSFTRLSDLESAYAALQHMVDLVFKGSIFINKSAEGRLCSSRLDIPIPKNGDMGLKRCMEENEHSLPSVSDNSKKIDSHASNVEDSTIFYMGSKEDKGFGINMLEKYKGMPVMKVLRWSFSDVIYACAQTQNRGLAEQLILQMQNLGLEPSCHTYDGLIKAIVSDRGFSDGMEVDQPERAVPILSKMKQLKLQPNVGTYELLFSLFGNVNAPYEEGNMLSQVDVARRIKAIEMDMMNNGIQHSHLSMKNLLKALGAEGMIRELMQYLHVAENQFFRTNTYLGTPIYNTVLHSLVEAKESHIAIEIFKNMISRSLPRDAATYNIMIDCCSTIKCYKSACALVSMMMRDGFLPWTLTYTALIKILLEHEDFDEALNLLDQARLEEIPPDVLLYNTILQKACLKGRIDLIELVAEQMHQEKIQPDPSTCYYVFSSYVDGGFFSTALESLQVLSMRMISEDNSTLEEKRTELEDFIHSEDKDAESQILQFFKGSDENLAIALLNLRWCAISGSPISWTPNESLWARRLLNSHGSRKRAS
ncbi:pentatricopeptide repeat-containing protein At1g76280 isoform X5 [Vitis riparia]|uniref:pentatricopeptide repeat-containing protein At1g76280 isoform X5 n=1 Tax=Vitis riparia TaxID=96939 RepID=UPI00155B3F5F|nr:pentatricopeptide repeat-containing protein At1g76280 isoform X5 [Vitis riparia]